MRKTTSGFTIVELLIVIVVIAILATISIVAYSGIQDRAMASTVKSDLANFNKKIEMAKVDAADGLYPTAPTASMGVAVSKNVYRVDRYNWYYCVSADRANYALGVVDERNRGYYQSSVNGLQENPGGVSAANTCTVVGGSGGVQGHTWNSTTSTGTWQPWTN